MAITFVGEEHADVAGFTSEASAPYGSAGYHEATVNVPAGVVDGDLLIAWSVCLDANNPVHARDYTASVGMFLGDDGYDQPWSPFVIDDPDTVWTPLSYITDPGSFPKAGLIFYVRRWHTGDPSSHVFGTYGTVSNVKGGQVGMVAYRGVGSIGMENNSSFLVQNDNVGSSSAFSATLASHVVGLPYDVVGVYLWGLLGEAWGSFGTVSVPSLTTRYDNSRSSTFPTSSSYARILIQDETIAARDDFADQTVSTTADTTSDNVFGGYRLILAPPVPPNPVWDAWAWGASGRWQII